MYIVKKAIEIAGSLDPTAVRDAMPKVKSMESSAKPVSGENLITETIANSFSPFPSPPGTQTEKTSGAHRGSMPADY